MRSLEEAMEASMTDEGEWHAFDIPNRGKKRAICFVDNYVIVVTKVVPPEDPGFIREPEMFPPLANTFILEGTQYIEIKGLGDMVTNFTAKLTAGSTYQHNTTDVKWSIIQEPTVYIVTYFGAEKAQEGLRRNYDSLLKVDDDGEFVKQCQRWVGQIVEEYFNVKSK